jgi:hypothetical protein
MCEHEIPLPVIGASIYFCLINFQAFLHSFVQRKVFVFLVNLMIGAIIIAKFFINNLLNYVIPLNI